MLIQSQSVLAKLLGNYLVPENSVSVSAASSSSHVASERVRERQPGNRHLKPPVSPFPWGGWQSEWKPLP